MAELTKLESKLAEVTRLAIAAQAATKKVIGSTEGEDAALTSQLEGMGQEAVETEERCAQIAGGFDGKTTPLLEEAAARKRRAPR